MNISHYRIVDADILADLELIAKCKLTLYAKKLNGSCVDD